MSEITYPLGLMNREVRLVAHPSGIPGENLFEVVESAIPAPAEGQMLIRNSYFSIDPYMRPRTGDARAYAAPFTLGEAMPGGAVGRVSASRHPDFAEGDWVLHTLGWREWALSDGTHAWKVDPSVAPISTALGVLGPPGFTAYYGLFEIGRPKPGETVFVSGASGAVGSAAGQMAKIAGCRVVGSAGSPEKIAWLRELGFDEAFDYRTHPVREGLAGAAPEGIDVYFDNVGGDHLEAALGAMRNHGRVVACGCMSRYAAAEPVEPRNLFMVVTKRLRIEGFLITEHLERFPKFLATAQPWVHEGRLRFRETIIDGIENAPDAFVGLLRGESIGKMLVKVGPAESE
ncbi:MAG TPA: NADP-dependent oxidoreductase [Gaiellaceae bacterium]|nr:NADP-dependent oxidoreductase [Gaiellaceae bacterium]